MGGADLCDDLRLAHHSRLWRWYCRCGGNGGSNGCFCSGNGGTVICCGGCTVGVVVMALMSAVLVMVGLLWGCKFGYARSCCDDNYKVTMFIILVLYSGVVGWL